MNSFQVEQVNQKATKRSRFSRVINIALVVSTALLLGATLAMSSGGSLTSFAQSLPGPQQVLGESSENTRCEGTAYQKPAAVALQDVEPGLHYNEDEPQFYTLYAANVDGLRSAVTNCDVRKQSGDYHALTSYTLNWQYDTQASAGQCTLQNVKIGLAINQYLPRLGANLALPADDRTTWDAYYTSLVRHENEHLALNKKYAADLHTALEKLSAPCEELNTGATAIINTHVQQLNSSNSLLDTQTNHGADTGAAL